MSATPSCRVCPEAPVDFVNTRTPTWKHWKFIRRVQGLGFTLKEVRELLELRHRRLQPCAPVRRRLEQKLLHVRAKLADLQSLEHELSATLRACKGELRKRNARCPLLSESGARKPENTK